MSDVTDCHGNNMPFEKSDHDNDNDETCSENGGVTISTMNVIATQEGSQSMCVPTQVMLYVIFMHS